MSKLVDMSLSTTGKNYVAGIIVSPVVHNWMSILCLKEKSIPFREMAAHVASAVPSGTSWTTVTRFKETFRSPETAVILMLTLTCQIRMRIIEN